MSLTRYTTKAEPAPARQTDVRRLVLIDTASRIATRILMRRREAALLVTLDVGPDEIEAFRLGVDTPVFAPAKDKL